MSPSIPQIAHNIAYTMLLGKPLIIYLGLVVYFSFAVGASVPLLNHRGIHWLPFRWHRPAALVGLTVGAFHGLLALVSNL
jgi:hypothetical protein